MARHSRHSRTGSIGRPTNPTPLFTDGQLRHQTIEALKAQLQNKLSGMVRAVKDINAENLVYRGVEWNERPDLISQLSYPPPDSVRQLGRLNRPGQSIFYASCAPPGVFYELRAQQGACICWSEWQVLEPLWMHNLGYHAEALTRMGSQPTSARATLTDPIPDEAAHNRRLRRQVALAFTEHVGPGQEHRYKQSVAISEFWSEHDEGLARFVDGPQHDRVAGFVYPTMQMRGDADNVALWPAFVHSSLALRQVQYVRVERVDPERSAFTLLTLALAHEFVDGTSIKWREELPCEDDRRCQIALEDGVWVQRDGRDRIYGPDVSS